MEPKKSLERYLTQTSPKHLIEMHQANLSAKPSHKSLLQITHKSYLQNKWCKYLNQISQEKLRN